MRTILAAYDVSEPTFLLVLSIQCYILPDSYNDMFDYKAYNNLLIMIRGRPSVGVCI